MEVVEEDEFGDGWGPLEWVDVEEPQGGGRPDHPRATEDPPERKMEGNLG
jgi:hypothetical protein